MNKRGILVCLSAAFWLAAVASAGEDLSVLGGKGSALLHDDLMRQMRSLYEARGKAMARVLTSRQAVAERREAMRRRFGEMLGPFPPKTPLKARTVGTIQCDGYRIERILFASRPNHHVTANLYLPTTGKGPWPGVLVPCGHSANGKAYAGYQSICILLATNGLVALIYDPIGQGERHQLLAAPRQGTTTHTLHHVGAVLVGLNTAHYRTWDGIRAMDYLAARKEVDAARLGCTGNSGGGTMTTWLMAIDDRIAVAAPSCFITTQKRTFEAIGPQDGEQLFPYQGTWGVEHADFITMRAVKPTRILAAEQDFFPIDGTRETYREAKAVYTVLGKPDQVDLFTYDDKHGFSKPRRQAAVQWMRRWLLGRPEAVVEPELKLQGDKAVQVTRTGQVMRDLEGEVNVATWNLRRANELAAPRKAFWSANPRKKCLAEVRRLIALRVKRGKTAVANRGVVLRKGYRIEKLILTRTGEVPTPALLFAHDPTGGAGPKVPPAVLYVDGRGKAADAQPDGPIEKLLAAGHVVMSIDVRGCGETADRGSGTKYLNDEFRTTMLAMHVGRPLLGQRVDDVLAALDVLAERDDVDRDRISLVGVGRAGPVALHAAALDSRFSRLRLRDAIRSWVSDVVARPLDPNLMGYMVPGALTKYDLTDLAAMLREQGRLAR